VQEQAAAEWNTHPEQPAGAQPTTGSTPLGRQVRPLALRGEEFAPC
jgi:hypothetical protein